MYLFLNTSSPDHIDILFATEKKILVSKFILPRKGKRTDVLFEVSKALQTLKKKPKDIKKIYVVTGPGAFSHLRTGIAIANAFLFVLQTPIYGIETDAFPSTLEEVKRVIMYTKKQKQSFLIPLYGKEPNITIKKKK